MIRLHVCKTFAALAIVGLLAGCEGQMFSDNTASANAANSTLLTTASTSEYGPYLADAQGRALYLIEGGGGCTGQCAEAWPPLLAPEGEPRAGAPAVREDLIGAVQRPNGSTQVTYNGHKLYYYVRDRGAGQVTGQDYTDRWGEWYLVTPAGQPLEDHHEGGGGS